MLLYFHEIKKDLTETGLFIWIIFWCRL